jgi:hypothetical protein
MDYRKLGAEMKEKGLKSDPAFGPTHPVKSRNRWLIPVLTGVSSCLLALAIAIPVTRYYVLASLRSGNSDTNSGLDYAKSLAEHCYPNSIAVLTSDDQAVADVFYSYNSTDDGYLTFSLHLPTVSSLSIFDDFGNLWHESTKPFSYVSVHKLDVSFSWAAMISGSSTSKKTISLNLAPFVSLS